MNSLRRPDGTVTVSRRAMEKVIYDFYSDLFDSHVYIPTHHFRQDGYVVPSVLHSEIRHAVTSIINGTARRNAKCPLLGKLARPCCCIRSLIETTLAIIAQFTCYLSFFTRVILNKMAEY
ncbi:hypothetical protein V3C99_005953 [Haemonchus contortus]